METQLFLCECSSAEHQIITHYDSEDKQLFLTVHLSNLKFFERLWLGIKYIFGYKCKYGNFQEFIFNPKDADRLIELGNLLKK
jgi:hypothetical protein